VYGRVEGWRKETGGSISCVFFFLVGGQGRVPYQVKKKGNRSGKGRLNSLMVGLVKRRQGNERGKGLGGSEQVALCLHTLGGSERSISRFSAGGGAWGEG